MNQLKFEVEESSDSNDHQVRIIIDGKDWLGDAYLGIDPPSLWEESNVLDGGETVLGRCTCGCEGCDDFIVDIEVTDHSVIWRAPGKPVLEFVKKQYHSVVKKQMSDYSWESKERTAERLVEEIFKGKLLEGKYKFTWASARIEAGKIKISFMGGYEQKLYEFCWDQNNPESAQINATYVARELRVE